MSKVVVAMNGFIVKKHSVPATSRSVFVYNRQALAQRASTLTQAKPNTDQTSSAKAPNSLKQSRARLCNSLVTCGFILGVLLPTNSFANKSVVGDFSAGGFLFKDEVEVVAIDDPEVEGIVLYLTDIKRNIQDRLQKDFFSDPSMTSLACSNAGQVTVRDLERIRGAQGKEVFSEAKGLNIFKDKKVRIRRVLDEERQTLVYVSYSTRNTSQTDENPASGRYKTSTCAIPLSQAKPKILTPEEAPKAAAVN